MTRDSTIPNFWTWIALLWCGTPVFANPTDTIVNVFARLASDGPVNQVEQFSQHETWVQRVLAISSSTTSLVLCLASMYMFLAIDPRRIVFRHQLIFFLLFFDLIKAGILLLYPTRVLTNFTAYYNTRFCHVVGFFTALSIEGADFAILTFAIHTYLLIFYPNLNVKVGHSRRVEGGLFTYRYYIYGTSFIIPIILASLAFIDDQGYSSFVCWCYLPQRPVWFRMVLSWVPRYVIVTIIFTCYSLIYYHVLKEIRVLGGVFTTLPKQRRDMTTETPSFFSALKYFFSSVKDYLFPKLMIPDNDLQPRQSHASNLRSHTSAATGRHHSSSSEEDIEDEDEEATVGDNHFEEVEINDLSPASSSSDEDITRNYDVNEFDNNNNVVQDEDLGPRTSHHSNKGRGVAASNHNESNEHLHNHTDIHLENLKNFRKRQRVIKKQMKSIFIYPLAYIFIWLFPFILYITQVNYERNHGPIYWLNCMGAFMQPFNGSVDSFVFFYREQPWKHTVMKKFERDNINRMDILLTTPVNRASHSLYESSLSTGMQGDQRFPSTSSDHNRRSHSQSHSHSQNQSHGHNSLSANLGVDINSFPKWRRVLSDLNLPFFQLPTEKNLSRLQAKYVKKLSQQSNSDEVMMEKLDFDSSGNAQVHDFSNVLQGNLVEDEFRSTLENFSLNFSGKNPVTSPSKASTRQPGSGSGSGSVPYKPRGNSVGSISPSQNLQKKNSISNRSLRSRQYSIVDPHEPVILEGEQYGPGSPANSPANAQSPNKELPKSNRNSYNSGNTLTIKRNSSSSTPNKKLSRSTFDSSRSEEPDDEMDFLEFLKKGP